MKAAARFWMERIEAARQQTKVLKYYLKIHYEDLIVTPVRTLEHICEFLDIPYSERMLDYHYHYHSALRLAEFSDRFNLDGSIRIRRNDLISIFSLTNRPPDQSRIFCYKNEMTGDELLEYEGVAGALLKQLGYETSHDTGAHEVR